MPIANPCSLASTRAFNTFEDDIKSHNLDRESVGIFMVWINLFLLFLRKKVGHFPESKELKQLIRNHVDPKLDLERSVR